MSDEELERRLDRLYRSLDDSAARVQSGWRARPATRRRAKGAPAPIGAWVGAGVAAAAAVLLLILSLRSESKPVVETARAPVPAPEPEPRRTPPPPVPFPAPAPEPPRKLPLPPEAPLPPTPVEAPKEPPKPVEAPIPPRAPEAAPPSPAPGTAVARASAILRETEGTLELPDRALRGRQKDVTVSAGDRLRATSVVKLTLGDDRIVLLPPRTVVEFRPEEKRLTLSLEQGEVLADLVGPGPELRVVTKSCEVTPLGTVFSVKVVPGRSIVAVEKGRVEVQSSKGRATLRAAESLQAGDDGTLGVPGPADFRTLAWARGHRAAELTLYAADFSKPGAWEGEIEKGVARAVARPGSGPLLHLATDKPMFEVPVRGVLTVICRADRASKLRVQFYATDVRTTYKVEVPVYRSSEWRTLTFNFDDFVPADRTKATGRPAAGAPVTDLLLQYGEEDERGTFWVDALKVTELRP
jgi:ferric-dicitrate binding protein FerR (iron transport regulator)